MDAISFLINEHDKVRKMFAEIDNDSHRDDTKEKMFAELCQELIRHETMEQEVWYPCLKNDLELNKIIEHLRSEEKSAAKTIKEFEHVKTPEEWKEKFLKLKKDVDHHASEEESNLFPKVKSFLTEDELEKLGKVMYQFKQAWVAPAEDAK